MSDLKWTALRHRMLRAMADGHIMLDCKNEKRAIWRPLDMRLDGQRLNLSAAESRAVNDFGPCGSEWAHTPYWQGDMDVLRKVELRAAGIGLLDEWEDQHPEVAQKVAK